jgi:hypothetical protein
MARVPDTNLLLVAGGGGGRDYGVLNYVQLVNLAGMGYGAGGGEVEVVHSLETRDKVAYCMDSTNVGSLKVGSLDFLI